MKSRDPQKVWSFNSEETLPKELKLLFMLVT